MKKKIVHPGDDYLILNIAGFFLKLSFKKTDRDWLRKTFILSLKDHYRNFLATEDIKKTDFTIEFIFTKNIASLFGLGKEKNYISLYKRTGQKKIESYYHLSLFQVDLLIRQIVQELLSQNQGFVIHASAVEDNNQALLFLGKSGAGKSTSVDLLKTKYQILSDDIGLIRKEDRYFYYYQQYTQEKLWNIPKSPRRYKIKAVFFLKKSDDFSIQLLKNKESILKKTIYQLFSQSSDLTHQVKTIMDFVSSNNFFFQLCFAKNEQGMLELFSSYEKTN